MSAFINYCLFKLYQNNPYFEVLISLFVGNHSLILVRILYEQLNRMKTEKRRNFPRKTIFLRFSFENVWKFVRNVVRNITITKDRIFHKKTHISYIIWFAVFKIKFSVKSEIAGSTGLNPSCWTTPWLVSLLLLSCLIIAQGTFLNSSYIKLESKKHFIFIFSPS